MTDDFNPCEGHPDGPKMGETFYCDGSCINQTEEDGCILCGNPDICGKVGRWWYCTDCIPSHVFDTERA